MQYRDAEFQTRQQQMLLIERAPIVCIYALKTSIVGIKLDDVEMTVCRRLKESKYRQGSIAFGCSGKDRQQWPIFVHGQLWHFPRASYLRRIVTQHCSVNDGYTSDDVKQACA